jgi:hypothetical protein
MTASTHRETTASAGTGDAALRWLTPALPRNRLAVLRVVAYLFAVLDVFVITTVPARHARLSQSLYQPLRMGRLLHVPVPTVSLVEGCRWSLVVAVVVALAGRLPRAAGVVVAVCYFEWSLVFNSYGKVDHDRLGFLLLLFAIPTVGHLSWRDATLDRRAGWVLRLAQIGAVATYFLSAMAKVRYGGWGWVNSATLERAVLRRGTFIGDWFAAVPNLLHVVQWLMLGGEFLSVLLWHPRWGKRLIVVAFAFHVLTDASLAIGFYPHLIALLAFCSLERVPPRVLESVRRYRHMTARTHSGAQGRIGTSTG